MRCARKPGQNTILKINGLPIAPTDAMMQGIPWHGFFALDIETGQLCKTVKRRDFQQDWVNDVLLCTDLVINPKDPLGIFNEQKTGKQ